MKTIKYQFLSKCAVFAILLSIVFISSCDNDDADPDLEPPKETGNSKSFNLFLASTGLPEGTVKFTELDDGSTKVEITIPSQGGSGSHPAHIHKNTGAAGGDIAISLQNVESATGKSETIVVALDDGTVVTYQQLINFDGHVNVHLSDTDLATLVAQGDIGPNEFSSNVEEFELIEVGGLGVMGDITFIERASGVILAMIELKNTPADGEHPAHVHVGSVVSGGAIAISLKPVDGSTGLSLTDFSQLDDGTSITFSQLEMFDGHVMVHLSVTELNTIVSAGDIGGNKLTGEMKEYALNEKAVAGISGTATFKERRNETTLVEIVLQNTLGDGVHPAHIHVNSAAEGGAVAFPLTNVDGNTGMSYTDIAEDGESNPVTYDDLLEYDGHINVHLGEEVLGSIVAQGDIGGNELTGTSVDYMLNESAVAGISGTATFAERKNGNALVSIVLQNTPEDGIHPAHIHFNSVVEGGGIFVTLNPVDGTTGKSMSTPRKSDDDLFQELPYEFLIIDDGHIKVHLSENDLATVVAVGDVGGNKLTGEMMMYDLAEIGGSGVSGTVKFEERMNEHTLATIMLTGTPADGDHPAHIHDGSVENPGGIVISLNNVDGNTGMSMTNIEKNDAEEDFSYDEIIAFNGHVKVHLSPMDLATVVAAGDIGGNSGARVSYANDIRPILDANCQISPCHGTNGGIPSFETYTNVSANAAGIKSRTGNGSMPPASSGKSLSSDQVQMIADWVDDGAPNN